MTPEEYGAHAWQFRGWPYTNPQQEMMADMMAVAAGFTSPQRVVADNGDDLEEIYAEIEAARLMAESHGIPQVVPNSLVVTDDTDDGTTDDSDAGADAGSGSDGTSGAGRGGRAHSRVTLIRAAR
jgi:capsid protein